ncbi:MAG: folate-binding protein YgfZ [Burkholderiales bacterium]|nr:folate-binding protein YgfZ [Burkholderiales bacterium]
MNMPHTIEGSVPLGHWGLIRARGADAVKFLQGQLTNDVAGLDRARARLAGFCSAKGRLQASFVVWKMADDELLLACSASVLPATLKRLSMFVLRAQCKLSDASAELALHGVVGESARALLGDMPVWGKRDLEVGALVRLPDVAGMHRGLVTLPSAHAAVAAPTLTLDMWRWLEVQSGIPTIEAATVDQFVPQMLNYELVGGVDFQKGCYPGQEVVARSQYRGTIKRRMFLFDCAGTASAGQEVFHSGDPDQPAGMVVNAAPQPDGGGMAALVEVKLAALVGGGLHLGAADGAPLRQRALPYALPFEAALPA